MEQPRGIPDGGPTTLREVARAYRSFVAALSAERWCGPIRPLPNGGEGADFAFFVEVGREDWEAAISGTSAMEARAFAEDGVNFIAIPVVRADP